jgi:rSAM/selenodomain-associated transferase 1
MQRMTFRPTLIVFAREPVAGRTKTRLIPALGARMAAALAHAFNLDAVVKAARIGVPVLVAGAGRSAYFARLADCVNARFIQQGPGGLGKRMARALEARQLEGAILIGTDTPTLPYSCLLHAIELLNRVPVVLGPSLDGGYYLIGVRGTTPDIFNGIKWGTGEVLALTEKRLAAQAIAYALAPWWYDVDEADDLWLLAAHLRLLRRQHANQTNSSKRRWHMVEHHPCPQTASLLEKLHLIW